MTGSNNNDVRHQPLRELDPDLAKAMAGEFSCQCDVLEMIASENFVLRAVLQVQGSVLINKYAKGYPDRRHYDGCEYVNIIRDMACSRTKELLGAELVNVQPHAGAQANAAVLHALINAGDKIMGLDLAHGGHPTHGMELNPSGKPYHAVAYGMDKDTMRIDVDKMREQVLVGKPDVLIAGWSAYPRYLDFGAFRSTADEAGAELWTDMAHFVGLVAAGLHLSPVPRSDVASVIARKTLGGLRSGMILAKQKYVKKLNSAVFPGQQGGPLMHATAGKAAASKITGTEEFKERQERTLAGACILTECLIVSDCAEAGVDVLTDGTGAHLVLVDLHNSEMNGQEAEDLLHAVGITANCNAVPFDPCLLMVISELRIDIPVLATRGLDEKASTKVADVIGTALTASKNADVDSLRARVSGIAQELPLYDGIEDWNLI